MCQTRHFFEDANWMNIPAATVVQLAEEGFSTVEGLVEYTEETLNRAAENLRRPV